MFNVSTLLLDDALKPATPLTNGVISETLRQFAPLNDILQESSNILEVWSLWWNL